MKKVQTVCMLYKHPKILLGLKKRGFGAGRWNGFGGKVEEGESIEEATIRETKEETGVEIQDLEKIGIINFEFQDGHDALEVHFFKTGKFIGEPRETEEMKPTWFLPEEIPYNNMWPDDKYWIPMFLAGKKFKGRFLFNHPSTKEKTSTILEYELNKVEKI